MKKAIELINNLNILNEEYVVLACSYGPDSMVLLNILMSLNLNIVVAHVNHNLRNESKSEFNLLKEYCEKKGIKFEGTVIKNKFQGNIEEEARKYRYEYFTKIVNKYNAKYLFTAHHGDDLIETIIMRLTRGTNFKGYSGFDVITKYENYEIVRPLIYNTKAELLEYVVTKRIPYALDTTNFSDDYTRNKIRHNVLPVLKDINPKVNEKFIKFNQVINEYNDYFTKEIDILYNSLYQNNRLDINEIMLLNPLIKKLLVEKILKNIYKNNINLINDRHMQIILDLINNNSNISLNLPKKVEIVKYYNIVEFIFNDYSDNEYDIILEDENDLLIGKIVKLTSTAIEKSNYIIRLNSIELELPLHIRTRKIGDNMDLKNIKGSQKIKDIFINAKIPKKERNIYPIVTDNLGKILWIPGVKKSSFDKQKNDKYDIILKYIRKGNYNEK